ncbi:DRY-EERY domain-containing protein [Aphelenchoides besseyi]|nr:DRY-EERY domain-containing protein [Aphelenchoides besseyi]
MWHEAKKQEKLVRSQMVDKAKRYERRRQYYESIRSDPAEFMQIHGRKCPIHVDASIAQAAESSNILRKWSGNQQILIDRFDARSHLDQIAEPRSTKLTLTQKEEIEEIQADYERYRILVLNDFQNVNQTKFLEQIAAKEFWQPRHSHGNHRSDQEKKKKLAKERAAIGFSYGDSTTVAGASTKYEDSQSDDSENEFEEENNELDMKFDVNSLTAERAVELSRTSQNYGLECGFLELLKIDQKEQTENEQIREIEKAKANVQGKHAKAERLRLKRQRASVLTRASENEAATTAILRILRSDNGTRRRRRNSSSSSDSNSSPKRDGFISFGGSLSGPTTTAKPLTPSVLTLRSDSPKNTADYQRLLDLKNRRSESPQFDDLPSLVVPTSQKTEQTRRQTTAGRSRSTSRSRRTRRSSSSSSNSQRSSTNSSGNSRKDAPLEIRSSMSESEKERIEIENRKRRIQRTKRLHQERRERQSPSSDEDNGKKHDAAQRLRRQMRKELNKNAERLKATERGKARKNEIRQRERDELVSDEARALRKREREKLRELDELTSRRSSTPPKRRSKSPTEKRGRRKRDSSSSPEIRSRKRRDRSDSPPRSRRSPSPKRRRRSKDRYHESRSYDSRRSRSPRSSYRNRQRH